MMTSVHCLECKSKEVKLRYDSAENIIVSCPICGHVNRYQKISKVQGKTVVLVDDNLVTLSAFEELFKDAGFSVVATSSGESALELITNHRPALAVLDNILPDINGTEIAKRLRGRGFNRLKIVMFTGDQRPETLADAKEAGVDHLFYKGDNIHEAIKQIVELVSSPY